MKEFKGDKRSKEYREWKEKHAAASGGVGDTVEKITTATGIKKVVNTVAKATGKPCGCSERRDSLNRKFPYKK